MGEPHGDHMPSLDRIREVAIAERDNPGDGDYDSTVDWTNEITPNVVIWLVELLTLRSEARPSLSREGLRQRVFAIPHKLADEPLLRTVVAALSSPPDLAVSEGRLDEALAWLMHNEHQIDGSGVGPMECDGVRARRWAEWLRAALSSPAQEKGAET